MDSFSGIANDILQTILSSEKGTAINPVLNQDNRGNLSLTYETGKRIGYGYRAGSAEPEHLSAMHLVVRRSEAPGQQVDIVTCYPIRSPWPQRRTFWLGKPKAFVPRDHPEKAKYPWLGQLAGAYLQQDYDIYGETPEDVLTYYMDQVGPQQSAFLRENISSFLLERSVMTDKEIGDQYAEIFFPGNSLEGWSGKTTRQWLHIFHDALGVSR